MQWPHVFGYQPVSSLLIFFDLNEHFKLLGIVNNGTQTVDIPVVEQQFAKLLYFRLGMRPDWWMALENDQLFDVFGRSQCRHLYYGNSGR